MSQPSQQDLIWLIRYIRDENRNPIGVTVGSVKDGEIIIGQSSCHPKDTFNKKRGIEIAIARALNKSWFYGADRIISQYKHSIFAQAVSAMHRRCTKYLTITK